MEEKEEKSAGSDEEKKDDDIIEETDSLVSSDISESVDAAPDPSPTHS